MCKIENTTIAEYAKTIEFTGEICEPLISNLLARHYNDENTIYIQLIDFEGYECSIEFDVDSLEVLNAYISKSENNFIRMHDEFIVEKYVREIETVLAKMIEKNN